MITKEQYIEIVNACEKYTKMYEEVLKVPMSEEFLQGMLRVLDLIKPMVKKD